MEAEGKLLKRALGPSRLPLMVAKSISVLPLIFYSREANDRSSDKIVLKVADNRIVKQGHMSHRNCCGKFGSYSSIDRTFLLGTTSLWSLSPQAVQVNNTVMCATNSLGATALCFRTEVTRTKPAYVGAPLCRTPRRSSHYFASCRGRQLPHPTPATPQHARRPARAQ